jgi:hypothetical protein
MRAGSVAPDQASPGAERLHEDRRRQRQDAAPRAGLEARAALSLAGERSSRLAFRCVTLAEVVRQLEALDPGTTIYAAKPWSADTRAVVALEPEDGLLPGEEAELDYFLEVDAALEPRP